MDVTIEPDLSNAAPFLAAAAVTGGAVTVPHWPASTQPAGRGDRRHPAAVRRRGQPLTSTALTVRGTDRDLHGVELDLSGASELTPVVAAVAALADRHQPHLAASPTSGVTRLIGWPHWPPSWSGWVVTSMSTHDGLIIHPQLLGGEVWRTYADHRMAQAGALLGLVVPDVQLDDIGLYRQDDAGVRPLEHAGDVP